MKSLYLLRIVVVNWLCNSDDIFSGILQADTGVIRDNKQIFRLFCHEAMRVFHDRLINKEDKGFFYTILAEMAGKHFSEVGCSCFINAQIISNGLNRVVPL